jgi:methyl-accepting chemotaxis protein
MHYKLPKTISTIFVIIILCNVSVPGLSHAAQKDIGTVENMEDEHIKCLQQLANTTIDMLIATRGVIAKNQELINRDPTTGNYYVKGFVPAVVGSQVANDFSLMTGHKLKQTSLKIRNPSNAPDEWERKVLKFMDTSEYSNGKSFGETIITNGKKVYRYMKPIYVEAACLQCHGNEERVKPAIRLFLKKKYPFDEAFGYKEGDLRGGISITFFPEFLNSEK